MGFFNIHSVAKHQKNEGGPFGDFFFRKVSMPKKLKPFSLSRYGMLRGKREKPFLVQFARPNDYTCDKQVLWERANFFFPGDNSHFRPQVA